MITVCIPCFNHEKYIRRCVLSAIQNTSVVKHILITDDSSTDNSLSLIHELTSLDERIKVVGADIRQNIGAHNRINMLIENASTDWIAILNSDDYYSPSCFASASRWIRHHECDLFFGNLNIINEGESILGRKLPGTCLQYIPNPRNLVNLAVENTDWSSLLLNQNYVGTTSNLCFRKDLWSRLGGFSSYRYVHDWDFLLRACFSSANILYNPWLYVNYRVHPSNTLKEGDSLVRAEVRSMFANLVRRYGIQSILKSCKNPNLGRELLLSNPQLYEHEAILPYAAQQPPSPQASICFSTTRSHGSSSSSFYSAHFVSHGNDNDARNILLVMELAKYLAVFCFRTFEATGRLRLLGANLVIAGQSSQFIYDRSCFYDADNSRPASALTDFISYGKCSNEFTRAIARVSEDMHDLSIDAKLLDGPKNFLCIPSCLSRKKRILIHTGFFAVGGVERLTLDVIKNLSHIYEFCILCTELHAPELGSLMLQAQAAGAHIYYYNQLKDVSMANVIARLHESYLFSLVWIINGSTQFWRYYGELKACLPAVPIIDHQVYDDNAGWINQYFSGVDAYADRFVAINRKIQAVFVEKYGIPAEKVSLIYHGYSETKYRRNAGDCHSLHLSQDSRPPLSNVRENLGISEASRLYLNVGRCDPQKDQDRFVDIANAMQEFDPNAFFLILGEGPISGEIDSKISRLGLKNIRRMSFTNDVRSFYLSADFLVITSKFEGLPIVLLESHAMGLPCASTRVGDIDYVLEKYGFGFVFASDDPREMAIELCRAKRFSLSLDYAEFAKEFSSSVMVENYSRLFKELS